MNYILSSWPVVPGHDLGTTRHRPVHDRPGAHRARVRAIVLLVESPSPSYRPAIEGIGPNAKTDRLGLHSKSYTLILLSG